MFIHKLASTHLTPSTQYSLAEVKVIHLPLKTAELGMSIVFAQDLLLELRGIMNNYLASSMCNVS
jgi:hypothetical protein